MPKRSCPFCGKAVETTLASCPFCREAIPAASSVAARTSSVLTFQGRKYMRRGFLYALMAGVIYFFAGGYSGMTLPVPIPPSVTQIFAPLLLALGLGLVVYGFFLYIRG